jgi:hypothetical protein
LTERYFLVHEHQGLFEGLRSESASDVFFLADTIIAAEHKKSCTTKKTKQKASGNQNPEA